MLRLPLIVAVVVEITKESPTKEKVGPTLQMEAHHQREPGPFRPAVVMYTWKGKKASLLNDPNLHGVEPLLQQ